MQAKKWYQSKTIRAGIIGVLISGLEILLQINNGEGADPALVITFFSSAYAIWGRIVAETKIE